MWEVEVQFCVPLGPNKNSGEFFFFPVPGQSTSSVICEQQVGVWDTLMTVKMGMVPWWRCIIKFWYVGHGRHTKIHLFSKCLWRSTCGSSKRDWVLSCLILLCVVQEGWAAVPLGKVWCSHGSTFDASGMWLHVFVIPVSVPWFWSPLGKGQQSHPGSGSWNCGSCGFRHRSSLEWKRPMSSVPISHLLLFLSPSFPPTPILFTVELWPHASEMWWKPSNCLPNIGEGWLMLCSIWFKWVRVRSDLVTWL